jgi:hypothetical protein
VRNLDDYECRDLAGFLRNEGPRLLGLFDKQGPLKALNFTISDLDQSFSTRTGKQYSFHEWLDIIVRKTQPFRDVPLGHIRDVRPKRKPGSGRVYPCQTPLLTTFLAFDLLYYCAVRLTLESLPAYMDARVSGALDEVAGVLSVLYPRNTRLMRKFMEVYQVIHAGNLNAGMKDIRRRRGEEANAVLVGLMYESFQQTGPSPYPREAISWAIASILQDLMLDEGDVASIAD